MFAHDKPVTNIRSEVFVVGFMSSEHPTSSIGSTGVTRV